MQCEFSDVDSPDPGGEQTPTLPTPGASSSPQESELPTQPSTGSNSSDGPRDNIPCLQYGISFNLALASVFVKQAVTDEMKNTRKKESS